jgi:hypothetical protein
LLEELVGETLSSVIFVADYLQLDFNGPRLSAFVWPHVIIGGEAVRIFGDHGYRDSLCAFIMRDVVATEESPEAGLVIRFDLGAIVVNPEPADLMGPEIAMLRGFQDHDRWMVWRPGEDTFAGRDWSYAGHPRLTSSYRNTQLIDTPDPPHDDGSRRPHIGMRGSILGPRWASARWWSSR